MRNSKKAVLTRTPVLLVAALLLLAAPAQAGETGAWEEEILDVSRSSFVQGATYLWQRGADTGFLLLRYNDETWTYLDVPAETWRAFQQAESLGRFFSAEIKGNFRRQQGEPLWRRHDAPTPEPVKVSVQCAFNEDCEPFILELIGRARKTLRVAAYAFTRTPIARALVEAHRRGVDVRVKIDREQADYRLAVAVLNYIEKAGIPVTRIRVSGEYSSMHNKFMVADDRYVLTGSYNYTTTAHVANWENIVIADSPDLARAYTHAWEAIRSH
jgi:phosphatidylserine/phosphatidylglycerophosphate/cardiolipin synthase-like enzyme